MKFVHRLALFLKTVLSPYHVLGQEAERKNRQKMESNEQAGMTRNRPPPPVAQGTVKKVMISVGGSDSIPVEVALELSLEKLGALGRYRNEDYSPGKGHSQERARVPLYFLLLSPGQQAAGVGVKSLIPCALPIRSAAWGRCWWAPAFAGVGELG